MRAHEHVRASKGIVADNVLDAEYLGPLLQLQRLFPAYFSKDHGRWVITRYDAIEELVRSGSLEKRGARAHFASRLDTGALAMFHEAQLLYSDPPDHTRLRRVFRRLYPADGVDPLWTMTRTIAGELLDPLGGAAGEASEVDLLQAFAYPFPVHVICALVGIGPDDVDEFLGYSRAISAIAEPNVSAEQIHLADLAAASASARLLDAMMTAPDDATTFVGVLKRSMQVGEVSRQEAISLALLAFIAGHETTVGLLSAAIAYLALQPSLAELLRAEPDRIPAVVQELVRLASPVRAFDYATTRDCLVSRTTIPAGAVVSLSYATANRDPKVFRCPMDLDADREERHLGYGLGRHACPGAPLANIEGAVAVAALIERFDITLVGDAVEWSDRRFIPLPVHLNSTLHRRDRPDR